MVSLASTAAPIILPLLLAFSDLSLAHSIIFPEAAVVGVPKTAESTRTSVSAKRAFRDRPDDISGYQVHVMYVLAKDGADETLDVNDTIATSVAAIQKWFVGQTQGKHKIRFDTNHNALDVTFLRLMQTDAEIASSGAHVRDRIEDELKKAGFNYPKKIYAVYYGGSSNYACGGGPWPPTLIGKVAALYLKGTPPNAPACSSNAFAESDDKPGYWEFSFIHEIFHVLGAVATCAPHHTREGHVSDGPSDLMYAGDLDWQPAVLDINRDDYFNHEKRGCLDVARSVFIDPAGKDSVLPPNWQAATGKRR